MIKSASKTSWVIRRMRALGVDRKTLVMFSKSEGRVHLEMAAPVWSSSLTLMQRKSLERCQRVANLTYLLRAESHKYTYMLHIKSRLTIC